MAVRGCKEKAPCSKHVSAALRKEVKWLTLTLPLSVVFALVTVSQ